MNFMTERKKRNFDSVFQTPVKVLKKKKLLTLFQNDEVFENKENGNKESPFTYKLKKNISAAFQITEDILEKVDQFQTQLEEVKLQIQDQDLQIDDIIEDHFLEMQNKNLKNFALSPIKFESARKSKQRIQFFDNLKKIQNYASNLFNITNLNSFQQKILQKLLLKNNVIISSSPKSGKTFTLCLYSKFIQDQTKDISILYITNRQNFLSVNQLNKKLKFNNQNFILVNENKIDQIKTQVYDYIIVDGANININLMMIIKRLIQLNKKCQLILNGFFDDNKIIQITSFFKITQKNYLIQREFKSYYEKSPQLSFSYEEDIIRSVSKFVKAKIEEEKCIKFKFQKQNLGNFFIVSNSKEEKQKLEDNFQLHNISYTCNTQKGQHVDCIIVDSIYEIEDKPKTILILNFMYKVEDLLYLETYKNSFIHIFLSKQNLIQARNKNLYNMISAFVFQDLVNSFNEQKTKISKIIFSIDFYEKKFHFYNYEKFILYLMSYNYIEILKIEERKRVNIFYIKNAEEMKSYFAKDEKLQILSQINDKQNYKILDYQTFKKLEPELIKLKKDAILNFTTYPIKEFTFKSSVSNLKKLKKCFVQILTGYNQQQLSRLNKIDHLYYEMKNKGFGHFSRSNKNEKIDFKKFKPILENIYFDKSQTSKDTNHDISNILPYHQNFKKHDVLIEFTNIYNKNLFQINKRTYILKHLNEKEIFQAINLELIKQIILDMKWQYKIDSKIIEKMKVYNFKKILNLLNKNINQLKKQLIIKKQNLTILRNHDQNINIEFYDVTLHLQYNQYDCYVGSENGCNFNDCVFLSNSHRNNICNLNNLSNNPRISHSLSIFELFVYIRHAQSNKIFDHTKFCFLNELFCH